MATDKDKAKKEKEPAAQKAKPNLLSNPVLRHAGLMVGCSLPAAAIVGGSIILASLPNIITSSPFLSLLFLPVVCLAPIVGGLASGFALNRFSKGGCDQPDAAITGLIGGLAGSLGATFLLTIAFFIGIHPFGALVDNPLKNILASLVTIFISLILCAIGSLCAFIFLNRGKKSQVQTKLQQH